MNESAARSAGLDYEVWEEAFQDNDRSQAEGETRGKLKLILDKNEKPLGVQIVGYRAGDLLSEWTANIFRPRFFPKPSKKASNSFFI